MKVAFGLAMAVVEQRVFSRLTPWASVVSEATLGRIVELLAARGYTAEKAAVRAIQRAEDPVAAVDTVVEHVPAETVTIAVDEAEAALGSPRQTRTEGSLDVLADMTGTSTGTGSYEDFLALFRDRYERLAGMLRDRVSHRSIASLETTNRARHGVGVIGLVSDIRSTGSGHWLLELEDRTGSTRALVHADSELYGFVDELLLDQVIAIEGTLADDGGIIFIDEVHQPEVPMANEASRADRPVEVALVSDLHVGSEEFAAEAWSRFVEWLDTSEAARVEYLVIGGDLVDGVGVYPNQSEELAIVDVYDQYKAAVGHLEAIPDDIEVVIIPGNHDAVRLAEPQPAFGDEVATRFEPIDATLVSNPGWVEIEGVTFLLYHGTSLDDVIASIPGESVGYEDPSAGMEQLLRKRHLAPSYGSRTRIAPEQRDHLVIDEVPDVLHAGHTHTRGQRTYRDVRIINTGTWQHQTPFQRQVNIDPDVGIAAILDLQTLEMTLRTFV